MAVWGVILGFLGFLAAGVVIVAVLSVRADNAQAYKQGYYFGTGAGDGAGIGSTAGSSCSGIASSYGYRGSEANAYYNGCVAGYNSVNG